HYLDSEALARLVAEGAVVAVKYGVAPPARGRDRYLEALVSAIGGERLISGAGELPALVHLPSYGLAGFTSGSVCLAPRRSMRVLAALRRGSLARARRLAAPIAAFEAARERWGAVRVLHEAVRRAGIAETGPLLPMLGPCPEASLAEIEAAARALVAAEAELASEAGEG
ncbi:MAG: dihydrodipicolinate synthase family protein, partial [Geminicoccaceae bacterium]|nr:dihydrodipicolinate synthase family protein [Geminicoccaceae bacterium]MDW8371240.1 dihydrodipicolinate synthase family protein [Geminicoccaceae bacterium]